MTPIKIKFIFDRNGVFSNFSDRGFDRLLVFFFIYMIGLFLVGLSVVWIDHPIQQPLGMVIFVLRFTFAMACGRFELVISRIMQERKDYNRCRDSDKEKGI